MVSKGNNTKLIKLILVLETWKGEKIWVNTTRGQGTWVQCTLCGKIHHIEDVVPIDKLYVTAICPKCDNHRAINCGYKEEDIVLYADSFLDERYFRY